MVQTFERHDIDITPDPIYQLALGFTAAKTLLGAHRLGLFEALRFKAKTAEDIALEKHLPVHTTAMLLDACVSLKLCSKAGDIYANTALAARYLVSGQRGYLGRFLDHFNDHMYPVWFHLEEAIKTGHSQVGRIIGSSGDHFFQAIDRTPQDLETFMQTMEEHSLLEGKALADTYDFKPHRRLLDVAGGTGAMSVAILERYTHLQADIFDRPPVCKIAEKSIEAHQMADRIRVHPGDLFTDALPKGADILLLSGILHNWPPEKALVILKKCRDAMSAGSILLISEQVINEDRSGPTSALLCSLNMLLLLEGAQEYSRQEYASFLYQKGFRLEHVCPTGGIRQLLIARAI